MSQDQTKSPAVESMEKEQAEQQRNGDDVLQKALEDTYPASDPVSASVTTIPTSPIKTDEPARPDVTSK